MLTAAHVCESKNSFPKDFKQRLEKQYPQMKDLKFPQPIGDYTNIQKIKIQSFIFVADLKGKEDRQSPCILNYIFLCPHTVLPQLR